MSLVKIYVCQVCFLCFQVKHSLRVVFIPLRVLNMAVLLRLLITFNLLVFEHPQGQHLPPECRSVPSLFHPLSGFARLQGISLTVHRLETGIFSGFFPFSAVIA